VINENTIETTADSAYIWQPLLDKAYARKINHRAMKKKVGKRKLSYSDRVRNTLLWVERKIVEFPFGIIKDVWWHRKTRYRGLAKLSWMRHTLGMLCNMYRVRYKLM
jgi:IS5 family transposase